MRLTQKQEKFCTEFVQCGNAAEAYRRSYDVRKMQDVSVWNASSRLMADSKICERIKELQEAAAKEAQVTLEGHLNKLAELRDMAIEDGQWNAAITAEVSRGKAAGLYTEKIKSELSGGLEIKWQE